MCVIFDSRFRRLYRNRRRGFGFLAPVSRRDAFRWAARDFKRWHTAG